MASHIKRFCVTGASGYLASWLIMRLLERGYFVRGTVRDLNDKAKTAHLVSLPGANENLELVRADLLDESSLCIAIQDCDGVFNIATTLGHPETDQGQFIESSINAALNVLRASKKSSSVKRVVMTSTCFAVSQIETANGERFLDESTWTSVEYSKEKKVANWGYIVGKTMAEKAAFDFAEENSMDLVTILPSLTGGPFLTPRPCTSVGLFLGLMTELMGWMLTTLRYMSYVHVEDVALAHILLMEDKRAKGRYLCSVADATLTEVSDVVSGLLESAGLSHTKWSAKSSCVDIYPTYKLKTDKLQSLGFVYKFDTLEKIFRDSMRAFIDKGYLS